MVLQHSLFSMCPFTHRPVSDDRLFSTINTYLSTSAQKRAFPEGPQRQTPPVRGQGPASGAGQPRCGPSSSQAPRAGGIHSARPGAFEPRPGPQCLPARQRRKPGTLAGESRGSAVAQRPHRHHCSRARGPNGGAGRGGAGQTGEVPEAEWPERSGQPLREGIEDAGGPRGEKEATEYPSRLAPPLTRSADERCHRQPEEDGGRGAAEEGATEGVRAGRRRCCFGSGLRSPRRGGDDTTADLRPSLPVRAAVAASLNPGVARLVEPVRRRESPRPSACDGGGSSGGAGAGAGDRVT
ncbi:hypothetical protein HispidOSU_008037 [Sigmodon hispidus]